MPKKNKMLKTVQQTNYSKRSCSALERNRAGPDKRTSFRTFFHDISLSLLFPSPHTAPLLPQPVLGERKAFSCCEKGTLGSCNPASKPRAFPGTTYHAGKNNYLLNSEE